MPNPLKNTEKLDILGRPIVAEKPPTAEETAEWAALAAAMGRTRK